MLPIIAARAWLDVIDLLADQRLRLADATLRFSARGRTPTAGRRPRVDGRRLDD
jgi:hypothetical protein